ncbi:TPA: ABC transporter substrate-binding protein [Klebsiella variicola subsp. variicola]|uniref:ABC transporter substrate-binding protein n=1 Tax=Klebsiella variicola TaxID=244366 RepID=UPI003FA52A9A
MKNFKITTLLMGSVLCSSSVLASDLDSPLEGKLWGEIVTQAKKEGDITFNVWYFQPQWRSVVAGFEKEYGIKVKIPEGTFDGNFSKLLAESRRDKGKMDVVAMSVAQFSVVYPTKALMQIDQIPSWQEGVHTLQDVDTHGYAVVFWGNQTGLAYDPLQLDEKSLPQTLDDLQHFIDSNPKKFGYNDPNNGGGGESFIQRILTTYGGNFDVHSPSVDPVIVKNWDKGWAWFTSNRDKILLTASGADSLTRLNDGELALVPAWQDHLDSMQKSGAIASRLKFYVPSFGMYGGGNFVGVAANSQKPAASLVFLNWLISADTQRKLNQLFGTVPMNIHVETEMKKTENPIKSFGTVYTTEMKKEFVKNVTLIQ